MKNKLFIESPGDNCRGFFLEDFFRKPMIALTIFTT